MLGRCAFFQCAHPPFHLMVRGTSLMNSKRWSYRCPFRDCVTPKSVNRVGALSAYDFEDVQIDSKGISPSTLSLILVPLLPSRALSPATVTVVAAAAAALTATVFPAVYGAQCLIPNHHAPSPINEIHAMANLCPITLTGSTTQL